MRPDFSVSPSNNSTCFRNGAFVGGTVYTEPLPYIVKRRINGSEVLTQKLPLVVIDETETEEPEASDSEADLTIDQYNDNVVVTEEEETEVLMAKDEKKPIGQMEIPDFAKEWYAIRYAGNGVVIDENPANMVGGYFNRKRYADLKFAMQAKGDALDAAEWQHAYAAEALWRDVFNKYEIHPDVIKRVISMAHQADIEERELVAWFVGDDGNQVFASREAIECGEAIMEALGDISRAGGVKLCLEFRDVSLIAQKKDPVCMALWETCYMLAIRADLKDKFLQAARLVVRMINEGNIENIPKTYYSDVVVPEILRVLGGTRLEKNFYSFFNQLMWGAVSAKRNRIFCVNVIRGKIVKYIQTYCAWQRIIVHEQDYMFDDSRYATRQVEGWSQRAEELG